MTEPTRRTVLAGAAGMSATLALAACGADDSGTGAGSGSNADGAGTDSSAATGALGALADIPVGGAKYFEAQKVIVAQPSAGQVKAYSAICTHQGCAVNKIENGLMICPCHMSAFKVADGSVQNGPATKPLQSASVKVENGQVMLG